MWGELKETPLGYDKEMKAHDEFQVLEVRDCYEIVTERIHVSYIFLFKENMLHTNSY